MITITHYLCIGCPLGCRLEVEEDETAIIEVRGFSCKRGEEYALQEHTDPRRMVTTTVAIRGGRWARLPVKSSQPVAKDRVKAVCQALHQLELVAPVKLGDVIVTNILNTGTDIIATRDMAAELLTRQGSK